MVKTRENIIIKINQVFIKFYVYKCLVIFLVKNSKKIYLFLEISGKKWGNVVNYKGKVVRSSVYWSIQ